MESNLTLFGANPTIPGGGPDKSINRQGKIPLKYRETYTQKIFLINLVLFFLVSDLIELNRPDYHRDSESRGKVTEMD